MKLKWMMFITAVIITLNATAQKPTITFKVKDYDFGQINEADGPASYVFEFTNTGSGTLVIQNVQASCGCTTPEWTREPIEPGKKGKITATYNPLGRPGPFGKQITVTSNASNENEMLIIRGTVEPKQNGNLLSFQMGALKYSTKSIQMDNVTKGKTQKRSVTLKNTSKSAMKVEIANLPPHITAVVTPQTLKPEEEGKIEFVFNSTKTPVWGSANSNVYVVLNGNKQMTDEYKLFIYANVVEDFSTLSSSDRNKAPIFEIKSPNVYVGSITKGQVVTAKIQFKNAGINPLIIRRIFSNSRELSVPQHVGNIKGGTKGELKLTIDTKRLNQGSYNRVVTVQTNDPQNSVVAYTISFAVK